MVCISYPSNLVVGFICCSCCFCFVWFFCLFCFLLFYRNRNIFIYTKSILWDKGGNLLRELSILNFSLLQSLYELHTRIILLQFYSWTRNAQNISWTQPWLAVHCHWCVESPHSVKLGTFLVWTIRKSVKRSVIQGYFCERINALINWLARKKN